jgi:hypothetical protein
MGGFTQTEDCPFIAAARVSENWFSLAFYPLLTLNGMLSSNFVVQYNTNLAGSNLMNLLPLSNLSASPYSFLDPAGDGDPAWLYRAFMR